MVATGPLTAPRRAAALAAAVALTTTGCGVLKASEPEAIAQPGTVTTAPDGLSPGPYALTTEAGAVITFDLPTVPAPDDEVERLRQDLSVEPVTYVELHIDNTEGTRTVQIDDLKVISHEGGQFPFQPAAEVLADWDPDRSGEGGFWGADGSSLDPQDGAELDARTHALIARYTGAVPAGSTGRELMIGEFDHLPETFDDVELSPYPNDRALDPAPVGHGPAQRQYKAGVPTPAPRDRLEAEPAPVAPEPAVEPPVVPDEPAPAPDPEPAQPQEPAEPAEPQQPVDPVEPQQPVEPQEPQEPQQPQEPQEPQQPQEPQEPQQPVDPQQPVEPQQPQQPAEPQEPQADTAGNPESGEDDNTRTPDGGATAGASPSPTERRRPAPTRSSSVPTTDPSATATAEPALPSGAVEA